MIKLVKDMNREEIIKYIAKICGFEMFVHNDDAYKAIALKLEDLLKK